jgi:hypothetical protein
MLPHGRIAPPLSGTEDWRDDILTERDQHPAEAALGIGLTKSQSLGRRRKACHVLATESASLPACPIT